MLRTLPLPCLPPLRVSEEAASRSRAAQCSRPSRRAVLRLHAVSGEGGGPPEPPVDAEARLESLEKRLRSRGAEPAARSERPLAGVPPKPLPVEPWSKRLEGKSALDAAWMLWVGEEGVLWWANKIAWQTVIAVIVGWVVFRIIGPATGLYTLKAGFTDLPGGSVI